MNLSNVSGAAISVYRGPTLTPLHIRGRNGDTTTNIVYNPGSTTPALSTLAGTSWVAAFACAAAASAASLSVAPTTLTNKAAATAPYCMVAHDSNSGVTVDWVTHTVVVDAGSANGYTTEVCEVRNVTSFVASVAVSSGVSNGSLTIDVPAGAAVGDLAILYVSNLGNGTAPTVPAGWASVMISSSGSGPAVVHQLLWKILVAADIPVTFVPQVIHLVP